MSSVGRELFDYVDYWFRYEFAHGRGAIHSHGVYFSPKQAKNIQDAVAANHSDDYGNIVSDSAIELEKVLQHPGIYNTSDNDPCFSPEFVSMHPAGGETIVNSDTGLMEWTPDKSNWVKPEGSAQAPL